MDLDEEEEGPVRSCGCFRCKKMFGSDGRGFESGQISVKEYSYSYLVVEFAPEIKFEL